MNRILQVVSQRPRHSAPPRNHLDRREFAWEASGWAGLFGGAAFLLMMVLLQPVVIGGGPMDVVRLISSIAMGERVVEPGGISALIFAAAILVHLPLSLIFARVVCVAVHPWPPGRAIMAGAAVGALLYALNFHAFGGIFPWMAPLRNGMTLFIHAAFGAIVAYLYKELLGPEKDWHGRYLFRTPERRRRRAELRRQ